MANFSKFLSLISGADRTVDLSNNSNILELGGGGLQMDGSTSGHIVINASATTSTYSMVWPAAQAASSGYVLANDGTGVLSWISPSSGSVTSVALALPASVFTVSGSPVTSTGTLTGSLNTQTANTVWAGPASGSAATPTFRALVSLDIPNNAANTTGTASNVTASSNATLTTLSALTTASSLSSVGTITSGTWNGTTIAIANGGTGQTSAAAAFAALSPLTTAGDLIYENATPTPARLAIGSTGQLLTVSGGLPVWASPATSGTVTSVSVVSTNGFAGTVATATSTPAITIETTITGILQGNGTAISAASTTGSGNVVLSASPTLTGTLTAAAASFSSAISMGGNQINNVANPTSAQDAATKAYVDSAISGLTWQGPAQAYANSNVPLTGGATLTIDGYSVQNGNLVILGNQTTASQNGEYSVSGIGTAYTLTANGLPTVVGDAWLITNGTLYGNSAFTATAIVPAAEFIEFAGPQALSYNAPLSISGNTVSISQATTSTNGYLTSTDWNTFNNKQPAGSYITALTGDATAAGPGSAALTLATVNSNVGSFGSSTSIPSFTVNAKGLITAASGNAVVAPAGTLSGTTLNSTVVSSSLTSVGTITTGVWNGTAIAIANGGTGQTTQTSAFDALSPLTTAGDTLYYNGTHNVRLGIGSTGQVLTVVSGEPAWAAPAVSPSSITLTQNHILVGNASNLAADVAMSGDVAIVSSGATTIQAGAVTATKLGTVTDGITTDQSGAGSTIEVLSAPAIKESLTAGEAFAATTLWAIRFAKAADAGFVAGRAYKADNDTTSADNFYVIGLAYPAGSVSTGGAITATKMGLINVPSHGFTPGQPLYLGASGAITATAPSAALSAVERVGIVRDANNIEVQIAEIGIN